MYKFRFSSYYYCNFNYADTLPHTHNLSSNCCLPHNSVHVVIRSNCTGQAPRERYACLPTATYYIEPCQHIAECICYWCQDEYCYSYLTKNQLSEQRFIPRPIPPTTTKAPWPATALENKCPRRHIKLISSSSHWTERT